MAVHWHSFHIYFERDLDPYLAGFLAPGLAGLRSEGCLKRVFFIRYSEGGYHLRLRLNSPMEEGGLFQWLTRNLAAFQAVFPKSVSRLTIEAYDRDRDYFGHTADTVYSELMNVATSELTLRLLAANAPMSRGCLLTVTMAALAWWLRNSTPDREYRRALASRSRRFAERLLDRMDPERSDPVLPVELLQGFRNSKRLLFPQFENSGPFRQAARVSRRLLARARADSRVFNHAMHLLCNKLGLGLADERFLFSVLEVSP